MNLHIVIVFLGTLILAVATAIMSVKDYSTGSELSAANAASLLSSGRSKEPKRSEDTHNLLAELEGDNSALVVKTNNLVSRQNPLVSVNDVDWAVTEGAAAAFNLSPIQIQNINSLLRLAQMNVQEVERKSVNLITSGDGVEVEIPAMDSVASKEILTALNQADLGGAEVKSQILKIAAAGHFLTHNQRKLSLVKKSDGIWWSERQVSKDGDLGPSSESLMTPEVTEMFMKKYKHLIDVKATIRLLEVE